MSHIRSPHTFSTKTQIVNILGFVWHMVSAATQLCHYRAKAVTDSECGWAPIKPSLWKLKFEFHITFSCHEIFFFFFSTLRKYKKPLLDYSPYKNSQWARAGLFFHFSVYRGKSSLWILRSCSFLFWGHMTPSCGCILVCLTNPLLQGT